MKLGILLLCSIMLPSLASAEIYKWRDANGVIRYSDTPPPSNVKLENYGKRSSKVAPQAATSQAPLTAVEGDATVAMKRQKAEMDKELEAKNKAAGKVDAKADEKNKAPLTKEEEAAKRAKDAEEQKKLEAQKKAEADIKAENCKIAKSNLAKYINGGRIATVDEKGERAYLSDADIAKGRAEAQAELDKNCG